MWDLVDSELTRIPVQFEQIVEDEARKEGIHLAMLPPTLKEYGHVYINSRTASKQGNHKK